MEQSNLLAYRLHDLWLEKLMMCRLDVVPQGFSKPTFQQLEAADKRLFLLMAEKTRAGIKATAQGRPCDAQFEICMNSTEVMSLLQPKPVAVRSKDDEQPFKRQKTEKPPGNFNEKPFVKGKGKGKSKQSNQFMRVPSELLSLGCVGATPQGHRLCFSYNLRKCSNSVQNQWCDKGLHLCAVKGCMKQHPAMDCPSKTQRLNPR